MRKTRILYLLLLVVHVAFADELPPPQTVIRDKDPRSIYPSLEAARTPCVPFNRRYEQLDAREKACLRAKWENLADNDEPPFPRDGLFPIIDAIRKAQEKRLADGQLTLYVVVEPDGAPSAIKVMKSPDDEMTRFAASLLMATKFKPAKCAGQPCRMEYPFYIDLRTTW